MTGGRCVTSPAISDGRQSCCLKHSSRRPKLELMHVHASPGRIERTSRVLRVSLVVTAVYIVLLVVAGIRAHSLALLSEAGHNLSDFIALGLSWFAVYLESRPASATKTFGWRRAGVLAALANSASLVVVAFWIFYEAFRRMTVGGDVHAST